MGTFTNVAKEFCGDYTDTKFNVETRTVTISICDTCGDSRSWYHDDVSDVAIREYLLDWHSEHGRYHDELEQRDRVSRFGEILEVYTDTLTPEEGVRLMELLKDFLQLLERTGSKDSMLATLLRKVETDKGSYKVGQIYDPSTTEGDLS